MEQREGRILRQGNKNKEVEIFNYVTEGTLDSYLYSTVTNKARFIAQTLDNECPARVSEDCDEKVLTYAEIQAIAVGNPDIKARIEAANELAELNMPRREWRHEGAKMRHQTETLPKEIDELTGMLAGALLDTSVANDITDIRLKTSDRTLYGRTDIDKYLLDKAMQSFNDFKSGKKDEVKIGEIGEFSLYVKAKNVLKFLTLEKCSNEPIAKFVVFYFPCLYYIMRLLADCLEKSRPMRKAI